MRRGNYQGPRRVVVSSSMRRDWEEYDPRMEEYYDPVNMYTSGPGLYLPSDNLPYSIRTSELPYKLFVSGIHPHTTEEGIRHIFSNYGFPLSVYRTRNKFNHPIAFVEFETQVEANNAIAQLDGKPPLNWEVAYAAPRNDERLHQQPDYCLETDYDRQTPLFTTHRTVGMRQVAYPRPPPEMCSSHPTEPVRQTRDIPSDQACGVCGQKADFLCTHCKARYCSPDCQSRDWPTHREICVPPPPLVPANNFDGSVMRAPRIHGPNVSSVPCQSGPSVHSTRPTEGAVGGVTLSMNARQPNNSAEMGSPHSYMIKGIHPLDQTEAANQQPSSTTTPRNGKIETVNMIIRTETHSGSLGSREVIMSGEATHSLGKTVCLQQNGHMKKSPASSRSPNWKNNGSPQSNSKTHGTPQQNNSAGPTANSHLKQNGGDTTMQPVSKTRNYPVSNYSSRSPITSPPKRTPPPVVAKIYAKEFSSRELKPLSSKPCEISVCFAKSPEEFYIQYACFREMLQKMTTGIQISAPNSDAIMNPAEGMPCLAVFHQDRQWYRGKVVKVFPDGVGVRYVDFGNTAKMPNSPENFRLMEHEFSEYPFFTFKAKLAEILPVDGNSWENDVKQKFKALTEDNFFLMEVVQIGTEILTVRLKSQDNTDIASVLIKNGLARTAMREFQISDELDQMKSANGTPSPAKRDPIQGLPISFDKLSLMTKPPTKQMLPVSPQSTTMVSAIPMQLGAPSVSPTRAALRGTPIVQPRVPSSPAILSPMRCKTPSVVASPSPSQPTDDSIVNVLEVGVSFMFSVNVVCGPGIFVGTAVRDEDARVLEFDLLAEPLESLPNFKPSVGSVVAAFSVAHGQWFRACITNVLKSAYDVIYVDFGNVEEGVVSVKPIPPTFQHVELAVNMKASGDLNAEITKFFEEKVVLDSSHPLEIVSKEKDGSVLAKFIGVTPSFLVSLKSWRSLLVQPEAKMKPNSEIQPEATTSPKVEVDRLDSAVPSPKTDVQLEKVCAPVREIQRSKWEPGFSSDVMIYVAEDVDRIYVQTVNDETMSQIKIIQEELDAVFPTSPEMKTIPAVGTCVAALFPEDGVVYRARIVGSNEGAICVFYMDYGNSCTVSLADIKALPDKLFGYPPLCQRVALARVHRPAGALPKAVQDVLLQSVNKVFNMIILPSSPGRTECTLTIDGKILNEVVVDLFEKTNQDSVVKTPTTMPKLETVVPQSVSPPKEKIKVDNTLGEYSYQDGPFLELPKEGTFQAVVLSAESPQVLMLRVNNDDVSAKLAQLENELAEYAEMVPRGHTPKSSEICIALFPDGKWHRAACLEVIPDPSGTRFTCIEVDHGHMHVIDLEFIRRIPKRFVEFLPYLAQQTILEGTENMEEISAALSERFSDILSDNSIVSLTVVGRLDDVYIVRIPKVRDMLSQEGLL